jgi:hypothetical protein
MPGRRTHQDSCQIPIINVEKKALTTTQALKLAIKLLTTDWTKNLLFNDVITADS